MSKPNGYLFRGAAFSSEESAFEILVKNREQELRFHETWEKEAKPYYFKDELSKLSIPKKIAEQADKTDFDELFQRGQEEFYQWFDHEHDQYKEVIYAYLVGKEFGVELVEVTDD